MNLHGFPPLAADSDESARFGAPRVLILGSFPSARSLEASTYYGNSRNHFWPLMATILNAPEPADAIARRTLIVGGGLAVWDVYKTCERTGSLDADIGAATPNDVAGFLAAQPGIRAVFLNGGEAARAFVRYTLPALLGRHPRPAERLADIGAVATVTMNAGGYIDLVRMPSTSPVPSARFPDAAAKLRYWRMLLRYLAPTCVPVVPITR